MKLKILDSGSSGNCAILTDKENNQLILDCGVKYEKIITHINFDKSIFCLISHKHKDHSFAIDKIQQCGISVYAHGNFINGQMFTVNNVWKVLPIELPHDKDTTSYSFIIYNTIENKLIYFATDCSELPNIADKPYDLIMCEINYDGITVSEKNDIQNTGYTRHLSLEYVVSWLASRQNQAKTFVATHLSNSGNISLKRLTSALQGRANNVYVAKKNIEIQI